jgi:hypothetical protein
MNLNKKDASGIMTGNSSGGILISNGSYRLKMS